jgi:hypothetical protein
MKIATIEEFKSLMKSLNELGPKVKEDVLNDRIDRERPKLEEELTKLKMSPDKAPWRRAGLFREETGKEYPETDRWAGRRRAMR